MLRSSRPRLTKQWIAVIPLLVCLLIGTAPSSVLADNTEIETVSEASKSSTNSNSVAETPKVVSTRSRQSGPLALALIGTASYPGGEMAFFDGNREEFKTSVRRGEKIGDWTVATIAFDHVRLTMGTNEFDLRMDKQLRRESSGEWQIKPMTGRFTSADSRRPEQSRATAEAGPDRRKAPPQQFSDAGADTRPIRTSRRTGNRTNRGGDPTGQ